jgi:hypothetical protein
MQSARLVVTMTNSMPYDPARVAREARVRMRHLRRRASDTEAVVRAALLAAVLVTLAVALTGALRSETDQVVSRLDAATHTTSVR